MSLEKRVVTRRAALTASGAALILGVSGCGSVSPINMKKKQRIWVALHGFKSVRHVKSTVKWVLKAGDKWDVRVTLADDPPYEDALKVIRNARSEVAQIIGSGKGGTELDFTISWRQAGTLIEWDYFVRDLEDQALKGVVSASGSAVEKISLHSDEIFILYRGADSYPEGLLLDPASDVVSMEGVKVTQTTTIGGAEFYIDYYGGDVDLRSVPLKEVLEAIDPDQREGATIRLQEKDVVTKEKNVQLKVAAFGEYDDELDADAAAATLKVVIGNKELQGVKLSVREKNNSVGDYVTFEMKDGDLAGDGYPEDKGETILEKLEG